MFEFLELEEFIEFSNSPWASPLVPIKKKDKVGNRSKRTEQPNGQRCVSIVEYTREFTKPREQQFNCL